MIVDTCPTRIGWVMNQESEYGDRYAIKFKAKLRNAR